MITFIISEKKPSVIDILEKAEECTEKKHREENGNHERVFGYIWQKDE